MVSASSRGGQQRHAPRGVRVGAAVQARMRARARGGALFKAARAPPRRPHTVRGVACSSLRRRARPATRACARAADASRSRRRRTRARS
eukprot:scaffold843_cov327-Prasinococcus_capsulatus_cf.AAC.23